MLSGMEDLNNSNLNNSNYMEHKSGSEVFLGYMNQNYIGQVKRGSYDSYGSVVKISQPLDSSMKDLGKSCLFSSSGGHSMFEGFLNQGNRPSISDALLDRNQSYQSDL